MTYQVLARKWRPKNFTELVGQEHVSQSLIHALQHNRLHHAYLFTGTRGVGKTTIARILAKAINCENLQEYNPCGQCSNCLGIDQGRFMDLIEVDAASRTRVEDTRDLLDNVQYAPNQGRYKVYLIDEVHLLSAHSFNALLKTLEEPPEHVKFLLATTDPQKIPVTVLSRCLQYNLKRLLPEQVERQMIHILQQEQITFQEQAIKLLSRAADGSMRDGLSLLDQAVSFGGGQVDYQQVIDMLGTVAQQPVEEILQALAEGNAESMMLKVAEMAELTPDFADLLEQILRMLHRIAISQKLPDFVDHEFDRQAIDVLAKQLSSEDVQLFYQIGLIGKRDLELAPDPRLGFEMVLLRMLSFKPNRGSGQAQPEKQIKPGRQTAVNNDVAPAEVIPASQQEIVSSSNAIRVVGDLPAEWAEIIEAIKIRGLSKELANNCLLDKIDDHYCYLTIDPAQQNLLVGKGKTQDKLEKALQNFFGKPLKLKISVKEANDMTPARQIKRDQEDRQQAAVDAINNDENVQALKNHFDARIVPGSIEARKE